MKRAAKKDKDDGKESKAKINYEDIIKENLSNPGFTFGKYLN